MCALQSASVLQCIGVLANSKVVTTVAGWLAQPGNKPEQLGSAETFIHVLTR
jgi:hypothetical protein